MSFVEDNARGGGLRVLGRITYELMIQYWPTPAAAKANPVVAERMNNLPKIVFSKTVSKPSWSNTRVAGDLAEEVRNLKKESGPDMPIMGSGTIVSQLTLERAARMRISGTSRFFFRIERRHEFHRWF